MSGLCPATDSDSTVCPHRGRLLEEVEFQLVGEETACRSVGVPGLGYKQGTVWET